MAVAPLEEIGSLVYTTLDWKDTHKVMNSSLNTVLDHHSAVFQEGMTSSKNTKPKNAGSTNCSTLL